MCALKRRVNNIRFNNRKVDRARNSHEILEICRYLELLLLYDLVALIENEFDGKRYFQEQYVYVANRVRFCEEFLCAYKQRVDFHLYLDHPRL